MQVETVPIDSIQFDPANLRRHPERNLAAIKGSLARFGQQKPVVVDGRGIVLAGNGTLAAASAAEPEAPQDFAEFGDDIDTEHQCPKCGYKWSGSTAPQGEAA